MKVEENEYIEYFYPVPGTERGTDVHHIPFDLGNTIINKRMAWKDVECPRHCTSTLPVLCHSQQLWYILVFAFADEESWLPRMK